MTNADLEGNGPSDEPTDDAALDVADYEADLTGDPVPDVDDAEIDDDLLADADTTDPEPEPKT